MSDSEAMVPHSEYNELLLNLSDHLSNETALRKMKFLLRKRIPDGIREKLLHPLDIFEHLEKLTLLGPDKVLELSERLFRPMKKPELCDMVSEYMERNKMNKVV